MDLVSSACRCVRETLPHSIEAALQKCIHSNVAVVDHTFYCADKISADKHIFEKNFFSSSLKHVIINTTVFVMKKHLL